MTVEKIIKKIKANKSCRAVLLRSSVCFANMNFFHVSKLADFEMERGACRLNSSLLFFYIDDSYISLSRLVVVVDKTASECV